MRNLNKKYQVFVSSTYLDLIKERHAVMSTLLKLDCIPSGMELFPASDDDQWTLIKRVIDESDYYVVIIAGKYGSEYEKKSFTQMEYEYALSKKKSIVAFIHKDISTLIGEKLEDDPLKKEKLEKFIRLAKRKVCKYWVTEEQLALELYHAIDNLKKGNKKDGWIRATPYNLKKLSESRNKSLKRKLDSLKKKLEKNKITIEQLKSHRSVDMMVSEYLDLKMKELDKRANEIYPGKYYLPAKDSYEEFSCRKLINSLSAIGIPIEACFEVIEYVIIELQRTKGHISQISTNQVREYISNALYSYSRRGANLPFDWEDKYIRRYGNPDRRITVIEADGNIVPLTFKYIKQYLLSKIFENIIDGLDSKKFLQTLRHNERAIVSKIILDTVKLIEMEQIDHDTLLAMTKTMILRQPHPWMTRKGFDENCIRYELEKANFHYRQIREFSSDEHVVEVSRHSIRELVHHSCSGILTIYGAYKGAQFISSLDYLINNLIKLNTDKGSYLFQYSSFKSISYDLEGLGTESNELLDKIKTIKILLSNNEPDLDYDRLLGMSSHLYEVFVRIISVYMPEMANGVNNDL